MFNHNSLHSPSLWESSAKVLNVYFFVIIFIFAINKLWKNIIGSERRNKIFMFNYYYFNRRHYERVPRKFIIFMFFASWYWDNSTNTISQKKHESSRKIVLANNNLLEGVLPVWWCDYTAKSKQRQNFAKNNEGERNFAKEVLRNFASQFSRS